MTTFYNQCVADIIRSAGHRYIEIVKLKQVLTVNANTVNQYAVTVAEAFCGYPYVVELPFSEKYCDDLVATESAISDWCSKACAGRFTSNVFSAKCESSSWIINHDLIRGVTEHWFWAFENEQDALMFSLKW